MAAIEHLAVVCNPSAGRGRGAAVGAQVSLQLRQRDRSHSLEQPGGASATSALLHDLAHDGVPTIIVGGDGLVHLAVNAFGGTMTPLGLVAAGTGNDFAGALGLSVDVEQAVGTALDPPRGVDLLREHNTGVYVATVATFGFSASVNLRANRMRFPRGSSRYTLATLAETVGLKSFPVSIVVDGHETSHQALFVAIANTSRFGGGMKIAPNADPTDNMAEVVVVATASRLTLLRVLPQAFSGAHIEHKAVTTLRGRSISVSTDHPSTLMGDGESIGATPACFISQPAALQFAGYRAGNPATDGDNRDSS